MAGNSGTDAEASFKVFLMTTENRFLQCLGRVDENGEFIMTVISAGAAAG